MNILLVDRALSIYGALCRPFRDKGARQRLSEHLMKKYIAGEKDRTPVDGKKQAVITFAISIGKSTLAVSCRGFILCGLPAVSARSCAALFSPSRCGLLPTLLIFCFVVSAFVTFVRVIICVGTIEARSIGCVLIGPVRFVFGAW